MLSNRPSAIQAYLGHTARSNSSEPYKPKGGASEQDFEPFDPKLYTGYHSNEAGDRFFIEKDGYFRFEPWASNRASAIAAGIRGMPNPSWATVNYQFDRETAVLQALHEEFGSDIDHILVHWKDPALKVIMGQVFIGQEPLATVSSDFKRRVISRDAVINEIKQRLDVRFDPKLKYFPRWHATPGMKAKMAQAYIKHFIVMARAKRDYALCEGLSDEFPQRLATIILSENTILYRYLPHELFRLMEETELLDTIELDETMEAIVEIIKESKTWEYRNSWACTPSEYAHEEIKSPNYKVEIHNLWVYAKRIMPISGWEREPAPEIKDKTK